MFSRASRGALFAVRTRRGDAPERYCEEIEGERKTDRAGGRTRPEMDERGGEQAREQRRERDPSSGIDLVVGSAGGGAGTQVLLLV